MEFSYFTWLTQDVLLSIAPMKHILVGTDRAGSNSKKVALLIQDRYRQVGDDVGLIDLHSVSKGFSGGSQYGNVTEPALREATQLVETSDGLIVVVPEYNGSMPGILKLFIDHLKYPDAFEHRPVCFVGIGGMFGGLRPVEHLQQVFGYRNAFAFPDRIFIMNVFNHFKVTPDNPKGELTDSKILNLLDLQRDGFRRFVDALKEAKLHATEKTKSSR